LERRQKINAPEFIKMPLIPHRAEKTSERCPKPPGLEALHTPAQDLGGPTVWSANFFMPEQDAPATILVNPAL
jgi:hypothetical protein